MALGCLKKPKMARFAPYIFEVREIPNSRHNVALPRFPFAGWIINRTF
jgi:hypothetical protein